MQNESGTQDRLRLRERRADFSMLYREMHYCYGRLLGLDGIGLWSWYRLHQHGGGKYEQLTGYGWTGQPSILKAHDIKHHGTLAKVRDRLIEAGLLVLARVQDVFTEDELDALREQARAQGDRLKIQKGSYLAFVHDPLTREDFVEWSHGSQCPTCPLQKSCPAHKAWRNGERMSKNDTPSDDPPPTPPQGVSKNDIPDEPSESKIDTPCGKDMPSSMSKNDSQGVSKSDTYPDRTNQNDNNNGVIVAELIQKGITEGVAIRLAKEYPEERIRAKIELLEYLEEVSPEQVSQNPAGYLRRAIEEDYTPPPGFRRGEEEREMPSPQPLPQRFGGGAGREGSPPRPTPWERGRHSMPRGEGGPGADGLVMAERRPTGFCERVIEEYGVSEELCALWDEAKAELAPCLTSAVYGTYIESGAVLIALEGGVARIATPNRYIQDWLANRLNRVVRETLEAVTGQSLTLEFVLAPPNAVG